MLRVQKPLWCGMLLIAGACATLTGCLTVPKDGQVVPRYLPFRVAGYYPDYYQANPQLVVQAYNYVTHRWDRVDLGGVRPLAASRYQDGVLFTAWETAVGIPYPWLWRRNAQGRMEARIRAYDLKNGFSLPPADENTLEPTSNLEYVRVYEY